MPRIGWGEPFALEDMPQMTAAAGARDLDPTAIGIGRTLYGTLYLPVESRPTAARVKLAVRLVERRLALPAHVGSLLEMVVVLSAKGPFGALLDKDKFLLAR